MVRVRPTTSSPPGTRSRRQTETRRQHHAKYRLSNGFSSSSSSSATGTTTTNHVKKSKSDRMKTRSRAANNAAASPNSARRKKRELQLRNNSIIINNHSVNSSSCSATGAELKRLHIAMRFKHEKVSHSSPVKSSTTNHNRTKAYTPSSATKNGNISAIADRNGLRKSNKNNISLTSNKNENKLNYRHQVLKSYKRKRETLSRLSDRRRRSTKSSEESDDDDDEADSENRDRKRRSALWVLNCEAEEFLFGETAAEKHEVVLPPKSLEPANKRRRMRATELGELLKETPLLASKLRKPTTSESEASSQSPGASSTGDKAVKSLARKRASVKRRIFDSDDTSGSVYHPEDEDAYSSELMISMSPYHIASSSSGIGSPRVPECDSRAVRLQAIIQNLPFRFSFEKTPTNEIWYQTFSRQESPKKTFQPAESPIILPYERSSLSRRAFGRLSRLPRKSPRCHASTLAILSSQKPGRSSRLSSVISTPLTVNCSYDTPISLRSHHSPRAVGPSSLSPRPGCSSALLQALSPTQSTPRRRRQVSIQSPPVLQNSMNSCELKATEYVADAVAFLDDPYVVQLLAEQPNPLPPITIKSIKKKVAPATRSSQKTAKPAKLDKNSNKREASPSKLVVPPPKTSPKLTQNGSHNSNSKFNNYVNFEQDLLLAKSRSPPSSPKHSSSRGSSRPTSPKHSSSRGSSGPSSPQSRPTSPTFNTRKSTRKSPIVLVSDICKKSSKSSRRSSPAKHGAFNCFGEEVLFQSVDWLPPLPSLDS